METAEQRVKRWIRPSILESSTYHVPDSSGLIKLDAMENPYSWPEDIKQAWLQKLSQVNVNRYPDADASVLKEKLSKTFAIPVDQGVMLGNGSDEIIQIIAMAVAKPDVVFLAPEPGFVMYRVIADLVRAEYIGVPLKADDFSLDLDAMLQAIERYQPAVVFLAWPNNPTGNLFHIDTIEKIITSAPGLVVLDEAYHVFAEHSFMPQLPQYENVLIMRTLSKLGLAGLRLGVLVGPNCWLNEFEKLRLPYNINVLTQCSAEFILDYINVLDQQAAQIRKDREYVFTELKLMPGVQVWPSAANFILFKTKSICANDVFKGLKDAGILLKKLHGSHTWLENCLRVTIGTSDENNAFLKALKKIL